MNNYMPTTLTTWRNGQVFRDIPELNQEKIDWIISPFSTNEIKYVIKTLHTNRIPRPDSLTGEFYQT